MFRGFDSRELPEISGDDGINKISVDVFKEGLYKNIVVKIPKWIAWVLAKLKVIPGIFDYAFDETLKEYK